MASLENAQSSNETSSAQLLIVDDEPIIVDLLRDFLEEEGFTVLSASNGNVALYLLRSTPIALVLTDFMMPQVNGIDLARQLRENPKTATIPVLLMSAAMPQQEQELFAAVIHKPFTLDEIVRIIRQFIPTEHETHS